MPARSYLHAWAGRRARAVWFQAFMITRSLADAPSRLQSPAAGIRAPVGSEWCAGFGLALNATAPSTEALACVAGSMRSARPGQVLEMATLNRACIEAHFVPEGTVAGFQGWSLRVRASGLSCGAVHERACPRCSFCVAGDLRSSSRPQISVFVSIKRQGFFNLHSSGGELPAEPREHARFIMHNDVKI